MRGVIAIAKKELNIYFTTPIAYVMFTVVALFAAVFFNGGVELYRMWATRAMQMQNAQALQHMNITDMVVSRMFGSMGVFIIIIAPFLSMRLFAEEKRNGTFQLLMTAPVRPFQIVLGKYLAAITLILVSVGIIAIFPVILSVFGESTGVSGSPVEWQTVATGLLGLFLLGAAAMSVGLFISSLTESVIVAALVSLIFLLILWVATYLTLGAEGPIKSFVSAIATTEHLGSFFMGRIELKDVVYFLSFIGLGLFLADRAVEGTRWA